MSNNSIWPIDMTLSGASTPGQSWFGSDGNEGVLLIPKHSSITEASPSDCLPSYPGHLLGESYPSAEMQHNLMMMMMMTHVYSLNNVSPTLCHSWKLDIIFSSMFYLKNRINIIYQYYETF